MKKILIIIIILIAVICLSYRYLQKTIDEKKTFIFKISSRPLIYRKKKLEFDDPDSFIFDEYFRILANDEYQYKCRIDEENIIISLNNERFTYPYTLKEKQKEIITEYVVKEVYVNSVSNDNVTSSQEIVNTHSSEGISQFDEYGASYLELQNSVLSFEKGTDLSEIIMAIENSIDTNIRVSVDYSSLNPNDSGDYPVFIYSKAGNRELIVKII